MTAERDPGNKGRELVEPPWDWGGHCCRTLVDMKMAVNPNNPQGKANVGM